MKLDQVAYMCNDDGVAEELKAKLGLQNAEWIQDRVTAHATVWGEPGHVNIAWLQFCDVNGIQFEIIRYLRGRNWLERHPWSGPFLSHVGFHLDPNEPYPAMPGCQIAQEARTVAHTAEHLTTGAAAGRRYHYRIYEISPNNYMKFIKRWDSSKNVLLNEMGGTPNAET